MIDVLDYDYGNVLDYLKRKDMVRADRWYTIFVREFNEYRPQLPSEKIIKYQKLMNRFSWELYD